MSDQTYLIVSYFVACAVCIALGVVAYLWLRRPMQEVADSLRYESMKKAVRKGFPLSMILFVLSSAFSVNYYGCEQKKYDDIVKDRPYIVAKNSEEVSEALQAVIWTVGLWSVIFALTLRAARRNSA
jgi:hypothetical protein